MAKNWIAGAVKKPGQLHRDLGVPEDEKIPKAKIEAASHSDNPKIRQRANFAKVTSKFEEGGKVGSPKVTAPCADTKTLKCFT